MNLDQIKYFMTIVDTGSLSSAAKQLGVSQPALSKYVNALEDQFVLQMFRRENVIEPTKNAFGEDNPDQMRVYFASKMYDQGYYIYHMDEFPIEVDIMNHQVAGTLTTIGEHEMANTTSGPPDFFKEGEIVRVGVGKVVYIKKEAVIVEEEEVQSQDPSLHSAKLIIKHGDEVEELYHTYYEGHLY